MVNVKKALKSAWIDVFLIFLFTLLLAGCADIPLPSWLTGEPDESILKRPSAVGEPPSAVRDEDFPYLSSVPPKPDSFSTARERRDYIKKMKQDKAKAEEAKKRLENILPP